MRLHLFAFTLAASTLAAQSGPPPHVRAAINAVEDVLGRTDDASALEFGKRLTPAYRATFTDAALLAHIRRLRAASGGPVDGVTVERTEAGLRLNIENDRGTASFLITVDDQGLLGKLDLMETGARRAQATPADSPWTSATWDNLSEVLRRAGAQGWSGVMIARRDGKEMVRSAVGFADAGRATALNTVYCIGSAPIDFTVTAIMILGQRGKLALDDPITKHFKNVPGDKRAMTIRHLLTGQSGLPDFFHDATDWNPDLAWVDRETAVRRMFAKTLRFAPGTSRAHSHAAFGLLAALIENVSGGTYQDFVRREILTPIGMTRTGFYGERLGLSQADFAVGAGNESVGIPNIPPNWGPTSWLVMGSGGMFSTLDDLDRYYTALESQRLTQGEWAKMQSGESADAGGSDRGFFMYHVSNGRGTNMLMLMNGEGRSPGTRAMTSAMERLALGR
jgi:CubicO group peptidase (beta-lactamase class C family)